MIKFEHINGTLCIMTESVPLTPDAKFPCVVRLKSKESAARIIKKITAYGNIIDLNDWKLLALKYDCYELIGYPVADGSKEWALWRMMEGQHVIHEGLTPCNIHCDMVTWLDSPESKQYTMQSPDKWLMYCPFKDGWQLYEPKLAPAFEVGALVQRLKFDNAIYRFLGNVKGYKNLVRLQNIVTKTIFFCGADTIDNHISPSEVVVDFGSFRGTIELNSHPFNRQITVKNTQGYAIAYINIVYLDTPTRELVQSLIRAQEKGGTDA